MTTVAGPREQTRARTPDEAGRLEVGGVEIG